MSDEIKEILNNLRKCCDITKDQSFIVYQRQDILKLLDYITNLQQENEELKKIIKENTILVKDENGNYQECNINPLDYKSRVEKANKTLKNWEKLELDDLLVAIRKTQKILNGKGSDE